MTAKYVLHVGLHKTGTTSIQRMLHKISQGPNSNFLYPFSSKTEFAQHRFAQAATEPGKPTFKKMLAEIKEAKKLCVISSEELCYLSEDAIRRIKETLCDAEVSIIFYQRNPITLLYPWWQEKIKHGSTETFVEFVLSCIVNSNEHHLLIPDVLITNWANYFGREAIRIFIYDSIPDVAAQFASELLSIGMANESGNVANKSYDYVDCELIRFWNANGFWGAGAIQSADTPQLRSELTERLSHFQKEIYLDFEIKALSRVETSLLTSWGDRIRHLTRRHSFRRELQRIPIFGQTYGLFIQILLNALATLRNEIPHTDRGFDNSCA